MLSQRWRPVIFSLAAVLAIWAAALIGIAVARSAKMTAEKAKAYAASVDLSKLSAEDRAKALRKLADMLNALTPEERRKARLDHLTWAWFAQMTEDEKSAFIEATMPTGFKQMLTAFEQLPEDKRRRTVDDALRRLRESQTGAGFGGGTNSGATNGQPPLSEELQARVRTIGLKTFYGQSSAQTKAELAPVLEEMQRAMESGRAFRGR
jgi:hypothetical protein